MRKNKQIYYNPVQAALQLCTIPRQTVLGGRGLGKSTIIADRIVSLAPQMPRGKSMLLGPTFKYIEVTTLPAVIKRLEEYGYKRDVNYLIGRRPPANWRGFLEPIHPPVDYKHAMIFPNGFCVELISMMTPTARGGNFDYVIADEVTLLKKDVLMHDVIPAVRGNRREFQHVPLHHGQLFTGNQPLTPGGQWVWELEDVMKTEAALAYRKKTQLYMEVSSLINKEVLGEKYFEHQKAILSPLLYEVEILCKRPKNLQGAFYTGLDIDKKHGYVSHWNPDRDKPEFESQIATKANDCRKDIDLDPKLPLAISLDFGSRFNGLTVHQRQDKVDPTINCFFVESPKILEDVLQQFCDYYESHPTKTVFVRGGSDGLKGRPNSKYTLAEDVMKYLIDRGWNPINKIMNREAFHDDKFRFWQKYLTYDRKDVPSFRINIDNAKEAWISMANAETKADEMKKDKRSERDKKLPQWKATHLSDAIDNYYYWEYHELLREGTTFFEASRR